MLKLLLAIVLLVGCGNNEDVKRVNAHDALQVKARLLEWAYTCDGLPAQNTTYKGRPHCGLGDAELYAGMGCLSGELRFCKAPSIALLDSRDTWLGAVAYAIKTHDKVFISEAKEYLASKPGKVCFDACVRTPMMQDLFTRAGFVDGKTLPGYVINSTLLTAATTAPEGYQLRLIADEVVVYRKLGVKISSKIGRTLYDRQPCNSYFRLLAHGSFSLKNVDIPKGTGKLWRFSDSCNEMDASKSNGNMEIYLINLLTEGI